MNLSTSSTVVILSIAKYLGYADISTLNTLNKYFNKVLLMFPIDLSFTKMHICMFDKYFKRRNNINIVGLSVYFRNVDVNLSSLIPFLPQMERLSLNYNEDVNSNFVNIDCLRSCIKLSTLTLEIAVQNYNSLQYCSKLEDLTVRKPFSSTDSESLSLCSQLKFLTLIDYFTSLESTTSLSLLEILRVEDILVSELPLYTGCPNLREAYVSSHSMTNISSLSYCRTLIKLHINNADRNIDFSPLIYCAFLQELLINTEQNTHYSCQLTTTMFSSSLRKISLSSCLFDDKCSFEELLVLEVLILHNIRSVTLIPPLPICNGLKELTLDGMPINNLSKLKNTKQLRMLNIANCPDLVCIDFIFKCSKLVALFLSNCPLITTINTNKGLLELYLHQMSNIKNLKFLSNYPLLNKLTLVDPYSLLLDFTPITQCVNLVELKLIQTKITDLRILCTLKKLTVLVLKRMYAFKLMPLIGCTSLRRLELDYHYQVDDKEEFLSKVPKTLLISTSNKYC